MEVPEIQNLKALIKEYCESQQIPQELQVLSTCKKWKVSIWIEKEKIAINLFLTHINLDTVVQFY